MTKSKSAQKMTRHQISTQSAQKRPASAVHRLICCVALRRHDVRTLTGDLKFIYALQSH